MTDSHLRAPMTSRLEEQCIAKGVKMTEQRRVVLRVLSDATDHPDADTVFRRAAKIDPRISMATVYRTVHMLEQPTSSIGMTSAETARATSSIRIRIMII